MLFDEIVGEVVERDRSGMVLNLARESIRQASITTHCSTDRPVLPFHVTCADMLRVWIAGNYRHLDTSALGWAIAFLGFARVFTENLNQHRVIDVRTKS